MEKLRNINIMPNASIPTAKTDIALVNCSENCITSAAMTSGVL
jgi:hypothetical protein